MTYDARAEYNARIKAAEATASQESADTAEKEFNSGSKAEVDATVDNEKNGGASEVAASTESAVEETAAKANDAKDGATVVAGTATGGEANSEVDATKDGEKNGETDQVPSNEATSLPDGAGGQGEAENTVSIPNNANEISTTDAELPTDAENAPETPVEPYNTSESPEKLAAGVVSEIKKVETGVTQVYNEDRAVGELENIAQEMMDIIATKGAMTSAESAMFQTAVQNVMKGVDGGLESLDMPSMESFLNVNTAAYATEVSLEGVIDQINALINKAGTRVAQGFKNLVGLANSLTPYLDRMKKRAEAVRGNVNSSNREAGMKTVKGNFVAALQLDGSVPNGDSVVKTSEYMSRVASEIFSDKAWAVAEQYGKLANTAVGEMASETNFSATGPSHFWWILFGHLGTAIFVVKTVNAQKKTVGEMLVETSKYPSLMSAFPTVAKVNHSFSESGDSEYLDGKRSFPLFGNTAVVVSDFKPKVKLTIRQSNFPKLTMISLVGDKSAAASEIQTLTSKQQGQVLDNTITTLDSVIRYYKGFAQRNAAVARVYNNAFEAGLRAKSGPGKYSKYVPTAVQTLAIANMDGIFGQQGKIAKQFGASAGALIDYVEKSRAATQADDPDAGKAAANKAEAESA